MEGFRKLLVLTNKIRCDSRVYCALFAFSFRSFHVIAFFTCNSY